MNAKKCDRCGELYECMCVPDITVNKYTHGYGTWRIDLCDKCQSKLETWLKGDTLKNDVSNMR